MADENSGFNRRRFLGGVAGAAATGGVLAAGLPAGMAEALGEPRRRGSLDEVEHVVILMQENRSFDHYYGTMRGVRGYGDRTALTLRTGQDVFHQPDVLRTDGGALLPFHVDTKKVDGQDLADLDHSWGPTHAAWDGGNWDAWVPNKTELSMGYFTSADIPFQRAVADAFTVCDSYFCSIQGPTTPNRLFHWTGTIDPGGQHGGPAISNPDDYNPVYNWTTYPERLQAAGVSWQIFANKEVGDGGGIDGWVGDYGDNPLWLFQAYHDALNSSDPKQQELAARANVIKQWLPGSGLGMNPGHVLADFIAACKTGNLPRVSWVVAPYRWCEHPAARPVDGAVYVNTMLKALWGNEKLWNSTAVFLNFDENDGFFDHIVPPTAPTGTADEYVQGLPIGLGPRVPMTVVSPWSRGGWVNSQVFDHTSVIRFLEQWTGVHEPNISAWRRATCGDLTSCFDFSKTNPGIPVLPDTSALQAVADKTQSSLPAPTPPALGAQVAPSQEPGVRPARPLPYQPSANVSVDHGTGAVSVALANAGSAQLQLQVYSAGAGPIQQDVPAGGHATVAVPAVAGLLGYDIAVHGPNGFLRRFTGSRTGSQVEVALTVVAEGHGQPQLRATITNHGSSAASVILTGSRPGAGRAHTYRVGARGTVSTDWNVVADGAGWYEVTATVAGDPAFARRFAGHVEYGAASISG
ncbi:MAG TPA: phospholipase C, phosphocholine-specific [Pseudonocardiaceae bacterium]|jgi:phospholipase C|nr:phospholipase C, phosphocholine-specific [Pseudonocardiaceae bacterium]